MNNVFTFKFFRFSGDDSSDSLSELVFFSELRFEKILRLIVSLDASYRF